MLLTASNLFPRVGRPHWGMFNYQLFEALSQLGELNNIAIVPEWRFWRWGSIRSWTCPQKCSFPTRYEPALYAPVVGRAVAAQLYARSLSHIEEDIRKSDAVYSTWLYPDGAAMTELASRAGRPSWIMVQGSDTFHLASRSRRRAIREACATADGLVCVASTLADRLREAGVDSRKLHVVPNGVDTAKFFYRDREDARSSLRGQLDPGLAEALGRPVVVVFVGNIVRIKGVDILVDSCSILDEVFEQDWSLVMIGEGPDRQALEARARERGLAGRVCFAGSRPHDEIAAWMCAADCLALPSRSEGMPNVMLEAMAVGCPVVATDVGACREMATEYSASRIVQTEDAAGLGEAIVEMTRLEIDRNELAKEQAGRYSWDRQARTIRDLIYGN